LAPADQLFVCYDIVARCQGEKEYGVAAANYGPTRLATRSRQRDALDKLIASDAQALGVTLVTNNVSDFAAYSELKVENWVGGH
jgi:predicted nucleic acid-binding protein